MSENLTINCDNQKKLNFDFIKNLLILLLTHGLDLNVRFTNVRFKCTQHILKSCMDMIYNVRDSKDIDYVHDLTLTFIQYGANPNISLNISESIYSPNYQQQQISTAIFKITKNYILYYYIMLISKKEHLLNDQNVTFTKLIYLFYMSMSHTALFNCLKMLYTQQFSQVPVKQTEVLTNLIRDLYKRPRTLKQICRVKIYERIGRKPGLLVNKLNLPNSLKEYLLNFEH